MLGLVAEMFIYSHLAYLYDGAVKGFIALFEVLHAMRNAGFKREKIPLINRKYSSLKNIQRMINLDL